METVEAAFIGHQTEQKEQSCRFCICRCQLSVSIEDVIRPVQVFTTEEELLGLI